MEPSKAAMSSGRSQPRAVSSTAEESFCLTLTSITFAMDRTNKSRTLPDGSFCSSGIESLCLPGDFHSIGSRACENCKSLVEVNLMCTEITILLNSTFAHCVAPADIWLPPRLTRVGKEAFLSCIALREVVIPTELQDIGIRAFCGCEQLVRFTPLDWGGVRGPSKQNTMPSCCATTLTEHRG